MDFNLSDDQRELRDLAARILSDATSDEKLRDFAASGEPFDSALWQTLAEAGLLGLAVSEAGGGLGLGMIDLGLLLEEQGRTLAPLPLTGTLAMAAVALDREGSDSQKAWLPKVVAGEAILAVAVEELGGLDPAQPIARAIADGNGWRLSGTKMAVPYAAQAQALLVTATTEQGPALFLVDPATPGLRIEAQASTSGEPQAMVTLDGVTLDGDAIVGSIEDGARIVRELVQRGQVALAQRQVGVAAEALRRTADYSSNRIQFGKALGSFQAVQQRAADGFIDVEAMRGTALLAAWQIDTGTVQEADIATAKYWAAAGGHRVVHTAQHLHGGMGADVTYPIHRFFLTATQIGETLGGASPMAARIGAAIAHGQTEPLA
ncbi:acyl-CoA dehydrogenase family protein [Sphingomonas jatrophae]|uniref:Acyl-CoA dehydrogenase n=1 Tax=Sphingomonas jatrophae TaxID=1166337 RepID=A0A1I6KK34_9SPHN|nr:acyl-CoA dehydrogenase family protein [Sphingomonas jatrophae]SFR91567.1 Acyl-CoA dehydrogenase [Sphingomonas jatrophae]